ncbi:hypothetical protein BGX31_005700, partial [Mortierella sp. GBA43]
MTFQPDFEDEDEHGQEFRNEIVTVEQDKSVAQNTSVPMVAPNDEDDIEDLDTEDDGDEQDLLPTRAPPRRTYEPDHQDEDEDEDEDEEIPDPVEQDDRVAQEESKPARARGKKKKSSLPIPPGFDPINSNPETYHKAFVQLPLELDCNELNVFRLFFPDTILDTIVNNTN